MPGLLPDVDPDGLLEYSVVYSDRAVNHMSQSFQGVMRDISATLKQVYKAQSAIVVPGSGTFGMEAVARQFATGQRCLVIRNGWFSYRWTQIFDMGGIPSASTVLKARTVEAGRQAAVRAGADRRSGGGHRGGKAGRGVRPARRNRVRHHPARRLPAQGGRCGARGRRHVRPRLHRLGHHVGRHAGDRRRRADQRAAERLERFAMLRAGDAVEARARENRWHHQHQFRLRPAQVAADHGSVRAGRLRLPRHLADRCAGGRCATSCGRPRPTASTRCATNSRSWAGACAHCWSPKAFGAWRRKASRRPAWWSATPTTTPSSRPRSSPQAGLQIGAGVPLQCDEPADFKTFRIGLFGLDKLHNIERTVATFAKALDTLA